ncbi:MAG: pyridoxamine 5'-phosphate oxidase family protein, partial [Beijerinckiaceae bacterium]|nr:pyridoxamine 5'-phosphate oxidase family protein [Beijerinckiaceae bacterium]
FFTDAQREVQDRAGSRPMADRLEAVLVHDRLTAADAAFVARQNMVFLATNDAHDQPQCSYKGGARGFVSVIDDETLAFPDYDGNGMHLSIGNIDDTRRVALLFVDFEKQARMRVLGRASAHERDALLASYPGASRIVRVHVDSVFSNCPRYVHKMQLVEESAYVPTDGGGAPDPSWKRLNAVADVLAPEDRDLAGVDTDLNKTLNRDS